MNIILNGYTLNVFFQERKQSKMSIILITFGQHGTVSKPLRTVRQEKENM